MRGRSVAGERLALWTESKLRSYHGHLHTDIAANQRMNTSLYRLYCKLERLLAPGLLYSQSLYEKELCDVVGGNTDWLDLGCGHQILPSWQQKEESNLVARCGSVVGLDLDFEALRQHRTIRSRVAGGIGQLPFRNEAFDLVTANMTVEHLTSPEAEFREVARVLRPNGRFMLHTPNRRGYFAFVNRCIPRHAKQKLIGLLEDRKQEDIYQTYYRANTREEIARLAALAGLRVQRVRMSVTSAALQAIPPLVVLELLWIRLLMTERLKDYRTNIIAILEKPASITSRL